MYQELEVSTLLPSKLCEAAFLVFRIASKVSLLMIPRSGPIVVGVPFSHQESPPRHPLQ